MSPALAVTRRLTQAVLGASALGTVVLAGHLALSHSSASATPTGSTGSSSSVQQAGPGTSPGTGSGRTRGGFSPAPGVGSGGSGGFAGGGTTTHGS